MTLEEVRAHSLWRTLNDQERQYLEALAKNKGNEEEAARVAYKLKPASVRAMTNKLRKRPIVSFLTQALLGAAEASPEEIEHYVLMLIRTTKDERIKARMIPLYMELKRWRRQASGSQRPDLGGDALAPPANDTPDELAEFRE